MIAGIEYCVIRCCWQPMTWHGQCKICLSAESTCVKILFYPSNSSNLDSGLGSEFVHLHPLSTGRCYTALGSGCTRWVPGVKSANVWHAFSLKNTLSSSPTPPPPNWRMSPLSPPSSRQTSSRHPPRFTEYVEKHLHWIFKSLISDEMSRPDFFYNFLLVCTVRPASRLLCCPNEQ